MISNHKKFEISGQGLIEIINVNRDLMNTTKILIDKTLTKLMPPLIFDLWMIFRGQHLFYRQY